MSKCKLCGDRAKLKEISGATYWYCGNVVCTLVAFWLTPPEWRDLMGTDNE
ncbi:MAG: hypothetical protein JKY67_08360 [Pseudomonadales bacterium]|nr:hypothetical protein [Pseudomonadales bacterium]